jgi:hypothetical protein
MNKEYIAIPKETLNKWYILLNMSGSNTKQAVAHEIDDLLESDKEQVAKGQIQAKITIDNEMVLEKE